MSSDETFRPEQVDEYPLNKVVGVITPKSRQDVIEGLAAVGISSEHIDIAYGRSDAQRIEDETDEPSLLGRIFGRSDDIEQRDQYIEALQKGEAVIRVQVDGDEQKLQVKDVLAKNGAYFVHYYGRWAVETLIG